MPTGSGKTVLFSDMLKDCLARGNSAAMVVRGRHLVDQASQRLIRENVPHGVMMSKHWLNRPYEKIQICSIDTLRARRMIPEAKFLVFDEAHMMVSESVRDFVGQYDNPYILSVTATPYVPHSLRHIADVVVNPISVQELIDQGYLVPPRYFAPTDPDLTGVGVSRLTGDYNQDQLADKLNNSQLVGDIVSHWERLGESRSTICFSVSVAHSKALAASFVARGITAEHCDADTPDNVRKEIMARSKSGETKVVCNVGILCTGVDMPWISALILARPTKSYNLYIQQCGRGTRTCPEIGKKDFLILDHAGNIIRHGFIVNEREVDLNGKQKEPLIRSPATCEKCFACFYGSACPICGFVPAKPVESARVLDVIEGELEELTPERAEAIMVNAEIERLKKLAKNRGYHAGWVYYRLEEKFGEDLAKKYRCKPGYAPPWIKRRTLETG